jgi:cysteine desulfurase
MHYPYYFDHNATTAADASVLEAMLPYFTQHYGNASSAAHAYGWAASKAVELAREKVAALLAAEPAEIIFTAGATESINLGLIGLYEQFKTERNTLVSFETEHKAVLETLEHLRSKGANIKLLKVDRFGLPDLEEIKNALDSSVLCIAASLANNETGVIFPLKEIAALAHEQGCFVWSDLTQAPGKMMLDVNDLGIDMACVSAHKMYGPKGIGALYLRRKNPRVQLLPLLFGGGQERGIRPGTLNVPGIVGMGAAAALAKENVWTWGAHVSRLRTWFEQQITDHGFGYINGSTRSRLPNTSNILFEGCQAAELLKKFSFMALASGSACSSAIPQASHVLLAMNLSKEQASASLRLSFGKDNTFEQVQDAAEKALKILRELKEK